MEERKAELLDISKDIRSSKLRLLVEVDARDNEAARFEELKGKLLSLSLKIFRQKRSLNANAYYWQLVGKLAKTLQITNTRAHNMMLRRYGTVEDFDGKMAYVVLPDTDSVAEQTLEADEYHVKPTSQVKTGKDGRMYRTYVMMKGSHEYNTAEMSKLIDGLVLECGQVGIDTVSTEELERMKALYGKEYSARRQM